MGPDSDPGTPSALCGPEALSPRAARGASSEHRVGELSRCQMLYFLPIFNNVKMTFKIFKLKLLVGFAEELDVH